MAAETKEVSGSEMSLKDQGNEFFKSGKYLKAAALYTQAIKLDPSNPTLYRYPFFLQNFHLFFIWVSLFTSFSWWVSNFASAFCFSVFSLVCFVSLFWKLNHKRESSLFSLSLLFQFSWVFQLLPAYDQSFRTGVFFSESLALSCVLFGLELDRCNAWGLNWST